MNRRSAVSTHVEVATVMEPERLERLVSRFAELHGAVVEVCDHAGSVLIAAGALGQRAGDSEPARASVDVTSAEGSVAAVTVICREGDQDHTEKVAALLGDMLGALWPTAPGAIDALADRNKQLSQAVERLKEIDRIKWNFLSTISHELRTPLTSIIGYSEMLLEGLAGAMTSSQADYIETILSKADQLLQMITMVLDVSLIESQAFHIGREPVVIGEVLDGVIGTLTQQAKKRDIALSVTIAERPRALGDRGKIRQILSHLIANAIKFSRNGGEVRIHVDIGELAPKEQANLGEGVRGKLGLHVSVSDSGIGIPPDKQSEIFQPFFQVDSSSTREYGGTGLGLSLAKSYVEAHGGFIWVDSSVGQGSTFTVSLPLVPEDLVAYLASRRKDSRAVDHPD